jgi:hypothetical protein
MLTWSDIEPQAPPAPEAADLVQCPRCKQVAARSLGSAGSALTWGGCFSCHHVWSFSEAPVAAAVMPSVLERCAALLAGAGRPAKRAVESRTREHRAA